MYVGVLLTKRAVWQIAHPFCQRGRPICKMVPLGTILRKTGIFLIWGGPFAKWTHVFPHNIGHYRSFVRWPGTYVQMHIGSTKHNYPPPLVALYLKKSLRSFCKMVPRGTILHKGRPFWIRPFLSDERRHIHLGSSFHNHWHQGRLQRPHDKDID